MEPSCREPSRGKFPKLEEELRGNAAAQREQADAPPAAQQEEDGNPCNRAQSERTYSDCDPLAVRDGPGFAALARNLLHGIGGEGK